MQMVNDGPLICYLPPDSDDALKPSRYTDRMGLNEPPVASPPRPRPALSLIDSTSIMVGIVIGSTIYESSPDIAAGAARWGISMAQRWNGSASAETAWAVSAIAGVWLAGGFIALIGALCYAELATA